MMILRYAIRELLIESGKYGNTVCKHCENVIEFGEWDVHNRTEVNGTYEIYCKKCDCAFMALQSDAVNSKLLEIERMKKALPAKAYNDIINHRRQ